MHCRTKGTWMKKQWHMLRVLVSKTSGFVSWYSEAKEFVTERHSAITRGMKLPSLLVNHIKRLIVFPLSLFLIRTFMVCKNIFFNSHVSQFFDLVKRWCHCLLPFREPLKVPYFPLRLSANCSGFLWKRKSIFHTGKIIWNKFTS